MRSCWNFLSSQPIFHPWTVSFNYSTFTLLVVWRLPFCSARPERMRTPKDLMLLKDRRQLSWDRWSSVMLDLMQQMMTCAHDRRKKVKESSSEVGILLSMQAIENSIYLSVLQPSSENLFSTNPGSRLTYSMHSLTKWTDPGSQRWSKEWNIFSKCISSVVAWAK
jgi:hypothetical protein